MNSEARLFDNNNLSFYFIIVVASGSVIEVQIIEIRILIIHREQWLTVFNAQLCDKAAKAEVHSMLQYVSSENLA